MNQAATVPGQGSHQHYFAVPSFPALSGNPAGMTVAAWFKPCNDFGYRGILMFRSVNGNDFFGLGHDDDHFDSRVDGTLLDSLDGSLPEFDRWFYIVWVWDNTGCF